MAWLRVTLFRRAYKVSLMWEVWWGLGRGYKAKPMMGSMNFDGLGLVWIYCYRYYRNIRTRLWCPTSCWRVWNCGAPQAAERDRYPLSILEWLNRSTPPSSEVRQSTQADTLLQRTTPSPSVRVYLWYVILQYHSAHGLASRQWIELYS